MRPPPWLTEEGRPAGAYCSGGSPTASVDAEVRLPAPMLSRPGTLPLGRSYAYEVKWDGFRAIVSTVAGLQVRSRRGWMMTDRLGELAELPKGLVLDGELVALGEDGLPNFPRLSERVLHGHDPITYVVFDVLARRRRSTMHLPYAQRRRILESLDPHGTAWCIADVFDDGPTLFAAVERQGLEGIVAKRLSSPYRPGMRDWVKVKNRSYWRFGQELDLAQSSRRTPMII